MNLDKKCLKKAIYVFLAVFLAAPVLNIPYHIVANYALGMETHFTALFGAIWPILASIAAAAACIVYVIEAGREEKKNDETH